MVPASDLETSLLLLLFPTEGGELYFAHEERDVPVSADFTWVVLVASCAPPALWMLVCQRLDMTATTADFLCNLHAKISLTRRPEWAIINVEAALPKNTSDSF